ncbi:MAG: PhnD/SsuA/transferrin family substrate-binding protein [Rhodospirillales bacterium]|nr:PhnD/SsuA/transferrin family substrate-binding protein [Rhodospirillales bacterium]
MSILGRLAVPMLLAAFAVAAPRAPAAQELQFGVLPNVSARLILTNYRPFREYLAAELGRPVEVTTAPDFREFHARTMAGAYDVVVTAANLGRVAQLDAKLELLAGFDPPIPALLVMRKAAPVASLETLRGKSVAVANPQSLVALRGRNWLREQGLALDSDYRTTWARNEDSLAQVLVSGDAPLAMMSMGEFRAIREEIRQTLDIHREFARVPNFFVLRGRDMPAAQAAALKAAILGFPATAAGREFFALSGVQGIRPVPEADIALLDGVADETRALLR